MRRASLLAGLLFYHSRVARVSASSRATCPPSSTRPPPPSPESSSHPVLPRLLLCPNPSASRPSRCASGGGHPSARFSSSRPCPLPRQLLPHVRLLDAAPFAVSILATAPPRSLLRTSLLPGDSAAARTNPVCAFLGRRRRPRRGAGVQRGRNDNPKPGGHAGSSNSPQRRHVHAAARLSTGTETRAPGRPPSGSGRGFRASRGAQQRLLAKGWTGGRRGGGDVEGANMWHEMRQGTRTRC